jgi:hypothetical protein
MRARLIDGKADRLPVKEGLYVLLPDDVLAILPDGSGVMFSLSTAELMSLGKQLLQGGAMMAASSRLAPARETESH